LVTEIVRSGGRLLALHVDDWHDVYDIECETRAAPSRRCATARRQSL
jgi:hypothetical protein